LVVRILLPLRVVQRLDQVIPVYELLVLQY
jgi:hypothetical protein